MATVTRTLSVPPEQVWEVLSDGWRYSNWVVGTSHMRAVDTDWPATGTRLLHASGVWPLVLRDSTDVVASEAPRRLELIAHGGALGDAHITLTLRPVGDGTEVEMVEEPVRGPGKWLYNPVADAVTKRRNVESLARLAALAERPTAAGRS